MSLQQDSARVPNPARAPVAVTCPQCGGPVQYEGLTSVECLGRTDCPNFARPRHIGKNDDGSFSYERALMEHGLGRPVQYCIESTDCWMECEDPTHFPVKGPKLRWRWAPIDPVPGVSPYPNGTSGDWAWAVAEEAAGRGGTLEFYTLTGPNWISCSPGWIGAGTPPSVWRHKP